MDAGLKRNCSRPYATASRARIAAPTRTVTLRSDDLPAPARPDVADDSQQFVVVSHHAIRGSRLATAASMTSNRSPVARRYHQSDWRRSRSSTVISCPGVAPGVPAAGADAGLQLGRIDRREVRLAGGAVDRHDQRLGARRRRPDFVEAGLRKRDRARRRARQTASTARPEGDNDGERRRRRSAGPPGPSAVRRPGRTCRPPVYHGRGST